MVTGKDHVMGWLNDLEKAAGAVEKLSTTKRLEILEQQVRDIIKVIDKIATYINDKENK